MFGEQVVKMVWSYWELDNEALIKEILPPKEMADLFYMDNFLANFSTTRLQATFDFDLLQ